MLPHKLRAQLLLISIQESQVFAMMLPMLWIAVIFVNSIELELPENKTLYPKLENNDIFENDALREFLAEVKQAIAENPDLRVRIIGHTDNVGNANDNYRLGLKYSRQVKWYLVNKGRIDRTLINAVSEGESKSIASNKTDRGRFLNRRIEIIYSTKN